MAYVFGFQPYCNDIYFSNILKIMTKILNKITAHGVYITLPIIIIFAYLIHYILPLSFFELLSFLLLSYIILDHLAQKNINIPNLQNNSNINNQREERAERMQMIGYMSSTIIHDLNNLLTAIIGFADLLLLQSNEKDEEHVQLLQIRKNADQAAKLVLNMLSFIKQQNVEQKVISVQAILRNMQHLLLWILGKNIRLSIDCTDEVNCILINSAELEQVIMNIIINAKDAIEPDSGEIHVTVKNISLDAKYLREQKYDYFCGDDNSCNGEYIVLTISDNGSGINGAMLTKMFKPFKSDKTNDTTINHSGSGLGLFNVQRIINNANGLIGVKTKINQGTSFDLFFKKHEGKCAVEDLSETKNDVISSDVKKLDGNILIVDNEPSVRMFVSCALSSYGFKILEAHDAEKALSIIGNAENSIKIVISDISMNKMSGIELAQEIEKKYPDIKIIIMSGYIDALMDSHARNKYQLLTKPYTIDDLIAKVNNANSR